MPVVRGRRNCDCFRLSDFRIRRRDDRQGMDLTGRLTMHEIDLTQLDLNLWISTLSMSTWTSQRKEV